MGGKLMHRMSAFHSLLTLAVGYFCFAKGANLSTGWAHNEKVDQ